MYLLLLYVSALIALVATEGTPTPDIGPMATVARCRTNCLQRLIKPTQPFNDESCQDRKACRICWDMCDYLIVSPAAFSAVCLKMNCQRGCKVACNFRELAGQVSKSSVHWKFKVDPSIQKFSNTQKMEIKWSQPQPVEALSNRYAFVYILLRKSTSQRSSQDWTQVVQVASTDVVLDQDMMSHNSEFWLLAVNKNGTVADIRFSSQSHPIKDVIDVPRKEDLTINPLVVMSKDTPIHVNVTVTKESTDGTLTATIQWEHPPMSSNSTFSYDVSWFLDDCDVYEDSPICTIPPQHYVNTVITSNKQKPFFKIEGKLVYNAQYKVRIDLDTTWYGEVNFLTDFCQNVDERTYTVCYDVEVQTEHNDEDEEGNDDVDPLSWNVNLIALRFDSQTQMVLADINWSVPFNHSSVYEYTVQCRSENISQWLNAKLLRTTESALTLKLYPHQVYDISVIAEYKTNLGKEENSQSDTLTFNTSWVESMPEAWRTESVMYRKDTTLKDLNGVIVGITCVVSIVLLGLIMLFIYKIRHSFKDIIITKTAVAKSNSYKSNVGCKVDYSNQLLLMSDEWELDPRLLKFSTPIGQGAFGKVVTGYYNNQKVAIKLIRDSAPLSYKEDLLAEINLMKRIGSHPNIVSMSGACTLSEPIALVMEYVPYGNLQNFLKKCRLEGDFNRKIGRPSEVLYSVMDEHGDINSGVITPADMLSFARQVAMAMEYLAAKKYVHRDLAARNVLLGFDKVVKVCDFGLSRDIYNDNQYHKLTSGKLPLKWMAIESLRERIFTTQSDVWSFGILLWEIITMGGSPYPNIALADLYYVLANGYRMEKPSNCSDELCVIMHQCWIENPTDRPTFTELRLQIEQLLSRDRNYLELENIDVPLSTSDSSSVPKSDDSDTLSLLSTKPSQHHLPLPSHSKTSGLVPVGKTGQLNVTSSSNSAPPSQTKKVAIKDPVTVVCIDQSTDWLVTGREDETTS